MKKILIIGLCLALTIILSACNTKKPPLKNDKETNTTQPEVKKEMTVSVAKKDGWDTVQGSTALIQYLKDGNSVIATRDIMPSEAKTPEDYIKFVKDKFSDAFNNVSYEDVSQIGVSDPNKYLLVYTYNIKVGGADYQMKAWITYIFHEGYAYTLTCGALSDNFKAAEADFRIFIESFKLVEK